MLGWIVCDMIKAGDKAGRGLVVGFMGEIAREASSARSALTVMAACIAPGQPDDLKKLASESAVPTLRHLGDVI